MSFSGLIHFIKELERVNQLHRITAFANPVLEIAEITDRITKNKGKALLFENNGTSFPLLINAYGSEERLSLALGRKTIGEASTEIEDLFKAASSSPKSLYSQLKAIPKLAKIAGIMPKYAKGKGSCQHVIIKTPDLSALPILKCWPYDGGRFITLPVVHTINPLTGNRNAGMYRMQVIDNKTTAMHWQMHKTGARHYEEWKKTGKRMPVSVSLGGDPVYTYAATAPLPENIDEYLLAGFLRKKRVKLVKCLTNDIYVPEDADIVIEGYVDPSENLFWEGPFGDHTGFYSLADWYPLFHVTCITHRRNAVYPATIVGVPPQEDAFLARATEKIFLAPVKIALQPEVTDFHMPDAGIAHNLMIISVNKTYPGQARKVISALSGAGQMMFTKFIIAVDPAINIRNYGELTRHILKNTRFPSDLIYSSGPLDVLDHSSDTFAFGGKLSIDATTKTDEENNAEIKKTGITESDKKTNQLVLDLPSWIELKDYTDYGIVVIRVRQEPEKDLIAEARDLMYKAYNGSKTRIILAVDAGIDIFDMAMVAWQVLGNSDPVRDIQCSEGGILFVDAANKATRRTRFPRRWPNVVCSDMETIKAVDAKWESYCFDKLIESPSRRVALAALNGKEEVVC